MRLDRSPSATIAGSELVTTVTSSSAGSSRASSAMVVPASRAIVAPGSTNRRASAAMARFCVDRACARAPNGERGVRPPGRARRRTRAPPARGRRVFAGHAGSYARRRRARRSARAPRRSPPRASGAGSHRGAPVRSCSAARRRALALPRHDGTGSGGRPACNDVLSRTTIVRSRTDGGRMADWQAEIAADVRPKVIIDDDPTGTQAVSDVDVILRPDRAAFDDLFASGRRAAFVLSNSRALSERAAAALVGEIARTATAAARAAGLRATVVLRGDSTLRGHVFAEVDAVA